MSRFLIFALLAVACTAHAQKLQDYEAGSNSGPCRIRDQPGQDSPRFLWSGRCANGYAQGEGVLRTWRPGAATVEKGQFSNGYRQGLWESYSRVIGGDREITNFLSQYEQGAVSKDAKNFGGVRGVKPRDVAGWAEVLTNLNYADAPPARALSALPPTAPAPAKPSAPTPAAPTVAAPAAAGAALPALSATYKGHFYVVRYDISDANGSHSDFMSYVAPDRASVQRMYDDYAGARSLPDGGKMTLASIDECDGRRGAGPYFALAIVHDTRDNSGAGAGWVCGAQSPDAAARAALEACKSSARVPCRPGADANVYLLVSTSAAGGSSQVNEMGTFGSTAASTRVWNNYDYAGCLWATGKLDAEGGSAGNRGEAGNAANKLHVDCRSYF